MAQYGTIYRLEWNTVASVIRSDYTIPAMAMRVDISDTYDLIEDWETPNVIALRPGKNPLVLRVINNDEDKLSPIRAKQATVEFISSASQFEDTLTFADSSDNRWKLDATADGEYIFRGFLMLSDIQQSHLPDPNVVVLTASDHLALLKNIALQTLTGENPTGKYKIGQFIGMALYRTGLALPIKVINNLRHGSGSTTSSTAVFAAADSSITVDFYIGFFYVGQLLTITGSVSNNITTTVTEIVSSTKIKVADSVVNETVSLYTVTFTDANTSKHIYDGVYLDALTFEKSIGESEDCYTVLEKILGEDCFITQWKGYWYIMRIDEINSNNVYPASFDYRGFFQSFDSATSFSKNIGADETRRLANADALRRYDRPFGYITENFDLESPLQIPCNVDYTRGDETADSTVQRTGYTSYELDCWTARRLWGTSMDVPHFTPAILRSFTEFGDEDQRFIMLSVPATETGAFEYIRSEAIPVSVNDRFTWSFDARALQDTAGDGILLVCMIILYGYDGSVYVLRNSNLLDTWSQESVDVNTSWKLSDNEITLFRSGMQWNIYDNANQPQKTEWVSFTMEGSPVPVQGDVYIHLFSANQQVGAFDDFDILYQNLKFEYHPYIGGTYKKYTKFHNKITKDPVGYFNAGRDKTVYIADSPKPLFKGTMFIPSRIVQLFSGSITFASPNSINYSGFHAVDYQPGMTIILTGTNAGTYTVVSSTYHVIGNTTEIIVVESISTVTESATVSTYRFINTLHWYDASLTALGNPSSITDLKPFGYIQAFAVWNQFRNGNRILPTSVIGFGSMWGDMVDRYSLTDTNPHTDNRYFMLISLEQNWKTALWSGVFIEVYRTDIGKVYTDTEEFKYLA